MSQALTFLNDMGADPFVTGELIQMVGLDPEMLSNPVVFNRMKDVIDYVKNAPDKRYFVNKAIGGKNIENKLDHLWGYVELHKQKDDFTRKIKNIDEEISFYEK